MSGIWMRPEDMDTDKLLARIAAASGMPPKTSVGDDAPKKDAPVYLTDCDPGDES